MSWRCDICDSYNEESSLQCYVCGTPRSAESIREGKIRAREEKIARINNGIYKKAYRISNTVFIFGLTISLVTIVVAIIIKIVNRQLDDLWHSLYVLNLRIKSNVIDTFARNLPTVFQIVVSSPWRNFSNNAIVVWEIVASNLKIFSNFAEMIYNTAKNNWIDRYKYGIRPLSENISSHLETLGSMISELLSRVLFSVSDLVQTVKGILNSAERHFN